MKLRGWIAGGLALAVLWTFVRGAELAPEPLAGQFLLGLAVGLPTAFLFRRTMPERFDLRRGVAVLGPLAVYAATFLRELSVATVDVTYRVVAPGPPIDPEVLYVPLRVESDLAVTTIANTITLTPGTIALDHDSEANALYVHVIDGRDVDAVVRPIRTWEDNALTVFGESASPTDQPPQVLVTGDEVADRGELRPADEVGDRGRDAPDGAPGDGATDDAPGDGATDDTTGDSVTDDARDDGGEDRGE